MPKITVFMPVYNAAAYLKESLDSILNQTFRDFEFLIIDDGSTDNSVSIIQGYNDKRIKLILNEKNMGLPYTRNKALELINTKYMALMDSDDICDPDRLKLQYLFLERNKDIDVVGSDFKIFFPNGKTKYAKTPANPEYIKAFLMFNICIANPSTMIRMCFVKNNNIFYREEYFVCQDYSFWVDVCKTGNISNINRPLLNYRSGHNNISKISSEKKKKQRKELLDQIHVRALKQQGFDLLDSDYKIINDAFDDNNCEIIDKKLIVDLYNVFKKVRVINDTKAIFDKKIFSEVLLKLWYMKINETKINVFTKIIYLNYFGLLNLNFRVFLYTIKIIMKSFLSVLKK